MKTSNQRVQSIKNKVSTKLKRRAVIWSASVTVCALLVLTVICSLPILGQGAPNINAYKNDPYYPIIQKINDQYLDGRYSIFDKVGSSIGTGDFVNEDLSPAPAAPGDPIADSSSNTSSNTSGNRYEETTLNQVEGVTEADLLKRSSTHAFYLRNHYLQNGNPCFAIDVYALDCANTAQVSSYVITPKDETTFLLYSFSNGEMFLSDDATRLTVIVSCVNNLRIRFTVVVSLDVTNVQEITEINRVYVSGEYLSSRKADGKLLIATNFMANNDLSSPIDYSNRKTYIPLCGDMTDDSLIPIKDIYVPNNYSQLRYTVLALLDERTLEVNSQYAAFSFALDINVSRDYVFVVRNACYGYKQQFAYGEEVEGGKSSLSVNVAEIVVLKYADGFEYVGCIGLDGSVKDRYSLDEKDGILRVFTTVRHSYYYISGAADIVDGNIVNASLYCVDLSSLNIVSSVEKFAPNGDEVKSARFDGDKAYVCTAVRNTDPVYFFDLSNLEDITYTDTGTIPGFSISLIKFGDKLLGIGQGEDRSSLKVELYDEADGNVVSVAKYERFCSFSYEYKAHFVDQAHGLIGLQIYDYSNSLVSQTPYAYHNSYLLLHYNADSNELEIVYLQNFDCPSDSARAFYKDNGVYVFGPNGNLFIAL